MTVKSCIPIIPSKDLEKSLRFWVDGLEFAIESEMRNEAGELIFCMLRNGSLWFMLNQRAGSSVKPAEYEGIRLYWAPDDLEKMRAHLVELGFSPSEIHAREYGQTEFFLADDDGFSHCFGAPTPEPNIVEAK